MPSKPRISTGWWVVESRKGKRACMEVWRTGKTWYVKRAWDASSLQWQVLTNAGYRLIRKINVEDDDPFTALLGAMKKAAGRQEQEAPDAD